MVIYVVSARTDPPAGGELSEAKTYVSFEVV